MKAVTKELPKHVKQVEIRVFSDWHIGDQNCDMKLINEQIKEVSERDNVLVILNGDLMNNATKTSISDTYSETCSPMEQVKLAVSLLTPIKDKILSIVTGNHDIRTYRKEGIDIMQFVAIELGIENLYSMEGNIAFIRFGLDSHHNRKLCYTIYHTHGTGGGRKEGAKAIRLADMASVIDADIYIHSHTHLPMIMKQGFFRVDRRNSTYSNTEKLFVNSAASINYGGYGQMGEFKPPATKSPIIYLNGRTKEATATL